MRWIDNLERKFRGFSIKGLMTYIVALNGFVFVLMYLDQSGQFIQKLRLDPEAVLAGQVWRLITYIFIPPAASPFWILFVLYFYYIVGNGLEQEWGSFKFNLYYLIGMLVTTAISFITGGFGTAMYLNLSLFLAFARIYPDYEILLFFILPVKVKYLAYLEWFFIGFTVLTAEVPLKILSLVSIVNYFLFFGRDIIHRTKTNREVHYNRKRFRPHIVEKEFRHKCAVCGITDKEDKNMEFRYCSKCKGTLCYCSEHVKDHEHI